MQLRTPIELVPHIHLAASLIEQLSPHLLCPFALVMVACAYAEPDQLNDFQGCKSIHLEIS